MGPEPVESLEFLQLFSCLSWRQSPWCSEHMRTRTGVELPTQDLPFLDEETQLSQTVIPVSPHHCWYLLLFSVLILPILMGVWRCFTVTCPWIPVVTEGSSQLLAVWVTSLVFLLKSPCFCFLLVEFCAFYRHKPFICHTHYCVIINVSISFIQSYAISKSICYVCCWYLFPCCAPPIAAFGYIDFLVFNLV